MATTKEFRDGNKRHLVGVFYAFPWCHIRYLQPEGLFFKAFFFDSLPVLIHILKRAFHKRDFYCT